MLAEGDTRVALHMVEEKLERVRGLGFASGARVDVGGRKLNYSDANANSGCTNATQFNEPCYNETINAGYGRQSSASTTVDRQTFTRLTCVRWVQDDNPELPADVLEPPASWTCAACDPATAPSTCGATGVKPCCTGNTRRVKVAVIPNLRGGENASTAKDYNRVTLEMVMTPTAKP